jgi:hypothetical protein
MRKCDASSRNARIALLLVLLAVNPYPASNWASGQGTGDSLGDIGRLSPIILVYTGVNYEYGEILASLIRESGLEDVTGAEIFVTADPEMVSLGASLPNTACIVVNADNAAEMAGLEESLLTYFGDGGGLVGFKDACFLPSAGRLAVDVFPVFANHSVKETRPDMWSRVFVIDDVMEVNSGLPESFTLMSMGAYFSADDGGGYLEVPGDWSVLYRDGETSSPQVVAHEGDGGGRSVAFPGIWVVSTPRLAIYYGNLAANEAFVTLFTRSVRWAMEGGRFAAWSGEWPDRLKEVREAREELVEEAEERRGERSSSRIYLLVAAWGAGLMVCALVSWRFILSPVPEAEKEQGI